LNLSPAVAVIHWQPWGSRWATSPASEPPNPLGFGIGGRAGVVFLGGVYAGGNVLYYFGGGENGQCPPQSPCYGQGSVSTLMYGGELGYGRKLLDIVMIRPQIGLGNATFRFRSLRA
jgi:hypothetical protein